MWSVDRFPYLWVKEIAYDSRPITSQSSWPSLRLLSLIWPAQLIISTPAIHSSTVNSVSRAKSWTCLIKLVMTCLRRGDVFGPIESMTCCVKCGSNFSFEGSGANAAVPGMCCVPCPDMLYIEVAMDVEAVR